MAKYVRLCPSYRTDWLAFWTAGLFSRKHKEREASRCVLSKDGVTWLLNGPVWKVKLSGKDNSV